MNEETIPREQLEADLTKMSVGFDKDASTEFLAKLLKETKERMTTRIVDVKEPCCGNCFFHRDPKKPSYTDSGVECHEGPPAQVGTVQKPDPFPFPLLPANEWCGKHKPE